MPLSLLVALLFWDWIRAAESTLAPFPVKSSLRDWGSSGDEAPFVPWQASLLRRFIREDRSKKLKVKKEFSVERIEEESSLGGDTLFYTRPFTVVIRVFRRAPSILKRLYRSRGASLSLILKSSLYSLVTLLIFRRTESWYKGFAKYYVHLDKVDKDIRDYGFHLRQVGTGLSRSLRVSSKDSTYSTSLSRALTFVLDTPCDSGSMEDIIMRMSSDVASLLETPGVSRDGDSGDDNNNDKSKKDDDSGDMTIKVEPRIKPDSLLNQEKAIAVLQARQADLSLRQARLSLLKAVQRCENLAGKWKVKAMQNENNQARSRFHLIRHAISIAWSKIQTVRSRYFTRIPVPPSIIRESQKQDKEQILQRSTSPLARHHLFTIEKMLQYFYAGIGQIQSHLENLQEVERGIIIATSDSSVGGVDGDQAAAWAKLDEWTVDACMLATHCLSTVTLDFGNESSTPLSGMDDIYGVRKAAKLTGMASSATAGTLAFINETSENHGRGSGKYNFARARQIWKLGTVVGRDLSDISYRFEANLEDLGLARKNGIRGNRILSYLTFRNTLRVLFLGGSASTGINLARYGRNIPTTIGAVQRNIHNFLDRRLLVPARSIINDVLLNKRVSLTDKDALKDSIRSLTVMIDDFLSEHKPKMSQHERKVLSSKMDMAPISLEYERELNRPIQNLLSGRIARLVLIQLQFVKKELLVSMQAIDDLFNANQVNLQLLAVTPVIMTILFMQTLGKTTFRVLKTSSRGRMIESSKIVSSNLRAKVRELERIVIMSSGSRSGKLSEVEYGKFLSVLYSIHDLLIVNRSNFDSQMLAQLQDDLRDLTTPTLDIKQHLTMIERLSRNYVTLLYPSRKAFSISR